MNKTGGVFRVGDLAEDTDLRILTGAEFLHFVYKGKLSCTGFHETKVEVFVACV